MISDLNALDRHIDVVHTGDGRTKTEDRDLMSAPQPEKRLMVEISPEVEIGVFANFVSLWHDADSFTLDFAAVTRPPAQMRDDESGTEFVGIPARIVSRVRIPPSQVFEIMKAMEQQLTAWERETGRQPGRPTGNQQ